MKRDKYIIPNIFLYNQYCMVKIAAKLYLHIIFVFFLLISFFFTYVAHLQTEMLLVLFLSLSSEALFK